MNNTTTKFAIFDFDGTLVAQDTFLALLKQGFKTQPWRCLFLIPFCPIFLITFIFKLNKTLAKSCLLWSITAFKTRKQIITLLTKTLQTPFQNLWFQKGIETLNELHHQNIKIIIATASGQIWVRSLLRKKFTKSKLIIGTKLKFFATGVVLASKNCRDNEKLSRIQSQLGSDFIWQSTWSDHIADLPILKKAQVPYIICPKLNHVAIFKKELGTNVHILDWSEK